MVTLAWNLVPVPVVPVTTAAPGVPPVPAAKIVGVADTFVVSTVNTAAVENVPPAAVIVSAGTYPVPATSPTAEISLVDVVVNSAAVVNVPPAAVIVSAVR